MSNHRKSPYVSIVFTFPVDGVPQREKIAHWILETHDRLYPKENDLYLWIAVPSVKHTTSYTCECLLHVSHPLILPGGCYQTPEYIYVYEDASIPSIDPTVFRQTLIEIVQKEESIEETEKETENISVSGLRYKTMLYLWPNPSSSEEEEEKEKNLTHIDNNVMWCSQKGEKERKMVLTTMTNFHL